MMLSRPCSASTGVRASGASTKRTPLAASSSRIFAVVAGSLVDVSMTMSPLRATDAMPSLPLTISSTCGAPVTHRNTMSASRATSAFVFTSFAPAASRSSSGLRLRLTRDRQRKPLGDEILRDAVAHEADADESDAGFVHVCVLLFRLMWISRRPSARTAPEARAGVRAR